MAKSIFILTCTLVLVCAGMVHAEYDMESDVTVGYNFLFNTDNNQFYRNHNDLSEGALVDGFHFALQPREGGQWFDRLEVDACLANRIDSSKSIRMDFLKHGKYSLRVKYDFFYDFFQDSVYNYGFNDRNLQRENLQLDFKWTGVKNFIFNAGYGYVRNTGTWDQPGGNFGDIFKFPFDKHNTHEEFRAGVMFKKSGFYAAFNQSWFDIRDESRYYASDAAGAGYSAFAIQAVNPDRSGRVRATIPSSTVKAGYTAPQWSTDFTFIYRDGSIDDNVLDIRSYYFTDMDSRSDFMARVAGSSDIPEKRASFRIDGSPIPYLNLEYQLNWKTMETDTTLDATNTLVLGANTQSPVNISEDLANLFYYKNDRTEHVFTARVYPVKHLDISAAYTRQDGTITNTLHQDGTLLTSIGEDYSLDRIKVGARYKAKTGTEISGHYAHESIDDPLFRTAGDKKNEAQVSVYQPLWEKVTFNFMYRDARLKNDLVQLDDKVKLLDAALSYAPRDWASLGVGYTRLDLNYTIQFDYPLSGTTVVQAPNTYNTIQNGVYAYAGFEGFDRIKGSAAIYYLDDTGATFPLSRWNGQATIEVGLAKGFSTFLSARYYNYNEDMFSFHNYSFNQLLVGLRWTHR